jgi:dihydrofolate reductase
MNIFSRLCTSVDGCVTTPEGMPIQLGFAGWDPTALGFYQLQSRCDAVLMGRTTFEPALAAPSWPWGDLPVYVLGSHRPAGTPEHVVVDADPERLLQRLRAANNGGDVHLVGGPRTIETFRTMNALDEFRLLVLPVLGGEGRRVTPGIDPRATLTLVGTTTWPAGVVELTYRIGDGADDT